jgi:hypothetical protein
MSDAPEAIWAETFWYGQAEPTFHAGTNVKLPSFSRTKYTRTDIHDTALARIADLEFARILNQNAMMRKDERIAELEAALVATRSIICEGAVVGFNHADGDWAERLYANNGNISQALKVKP